MNYLSLLHGFFQLKGNVGKTREQIRRMQDEKLRTLLQYSYDHSAFYRRTFEGAGITKEELSSRPLSDFPTIDKAVLMEHFSELVTASDLTQEELRRFDAEETTGHKLFKGSYHVVHSSGSTGKPGYFVYDRKAWGQMLTGILRAALWNMSMPQILRLLGSGPRIVYIAATDGRYGGAMAVSGGIEGIHAKQMFLDIKTPLTQWIKNVKEFRPNIVIGYPSAIKILGELIAKGEIQLEVLRVISCGEPLSAGLRRFLEKTFHTKVVNIYGASESLALGVDTGNEDGMILFDDLNYIEVENGVMYLTSLYNFVQPLIRYKISDQLVLRDPKADGSVPFMQAEILLGRNEDLLWFEDGDGNRDFLHPLAIEGFCLEGLRDYQFCQIDRITFEVLVEVDSTDREDAIREEMLRQMKKILEEKNLRYVQFFVRFVNEIMPDMRTGKKPLVVNTELNGSAAI